MEKNEDAMLVRPTCAPHYYRVILQKSKQEGEKFKRRSLKFSTGGAKGCIAGQLICLIDVDENVLPCSYFPKSAGNLKEQSFKEIWEKSVSDFFNDLNNVIKLVGDSSIELTSRIPHGEGRTYLREILLVADHNAYHLGQIVQIRKILGNWNH